jgi:hypothetical protein
MYREYPDGVIVRDARKGDLDAFHGTDRPNDPTVKAWVGEKDGEVRVIGGIARALDSRWYCFFDIRKGDEQARDRSILIARFAKMFIAEIEKTNIRLIYAVVDETEKNAVNWMKRLGFHVDPVSEKLMRWKKEVQ